MDYESHRESRKSCDEAIASGLLRDPICVENISVAVPMRGRFDEGTARMRRLVASWCVALAQARIPLVGGMMHTPWIIAYASACNRCDVC